MRPVHGTFLLAFALANACSFDRTPLRRSPWDSGTRAETADVDAAQHLPENDAAMIAPRAMAGRGAVAAPVTVTGTGTGTDGAFVVEDDAGQPNRIDSTSHGWLKQLTLDGSRVDAPLIDFPLLIRIRDPELQSAASDIHFLADDASTLLDFELEHYDATSGALVAWVRIPQLNPGIDTRLYIGYQDGVGDRSNPEALWSDYWYVWHLNEDPGERNFQDATNRATGAPQGDMTSANRIEAIAAGGVELDGVDDRVAFRNVYSGAGPTTISAWVQMGEDVGDNGAMVISFGREAQNQARFLMALDATSDNATGAGFYTNDISGPALPQGPWSHLVWSWDGARSSIYIDGATVAGPTAHVGPTTEGSDGAIGASIFSYPRFLKGRLDEVRVATRALSSAFIRLEYLSQRPDSTFIKSIAPQVPKP